MFAQYFFGTVSGNSASNGVDFGGDVVMGLVMHGLNCGWSTGARGRNAVVARRMMLGIKSAALSVDDWP